MNASSRRQHLLRFLRDAGTATAGEAAEALKVSERTLYRDVDALRAQGYRIQSSPGRGGGIALDPNSPLPAVHFDAEPLFELLLTTALLRAAPGMPWSTPADAAYEQATQALPPDRRRDLRRMLDRTLIGEPSRNTILISGGPPDVLSLFETAFRTGRSLRFRYVNQLGRVTQHQGEAQAFLVRAPVWHIVTWDLEEQAARAFRIDRLRDLRLHATFGATTRPLETLARTACPDAKLPHPAPRNGSLASAARRGPTRR